MSEGVFFIPARLGNGGGTLLTDANNGLSLSGTIAQLGQEIGGPGNPAAFLNNREIPMSSFPLRLRVTNQTQVGSGNFSINDDTNGTMFFFVGGNSYYSGGGPTPGVGGEDTSSGTNAVYNVAQGGGGSTPFNLNSFSHRMQVNASGGTAGIVYNCLWIFPQSVPPVGSTAVGTINGIRIAPQLQGRPASKLDFNGVLVQPTTLSSYLGDFRGFYVQAPIGLPPGGMFIGFENEQGDNFFNSYPGTQDERGRAGFSLFSGFPLTAKVHIGAGGTDPGTAPLKLESGSLLATAESGAFEYVDPLLYFTTSGTRRLATLWTSATVPGSGLIPFTDSNGRLQTTSGFFFSVSLWGGLSPFVTRLYLRDNAANVNVSLNNSRAVYNNNGATGQVDFTLPVISTSVGIEFTFLVIEDFLIHIIPSGGDIITLPGGSNLGSFAEPVAFSGGSYVGCCIRLLAVEAGRWMVVSMVGDWSGI